MMQERVTHSLYSLLLKKEKESANKIYLRQPRNGNWHELTWAETMTQSRKVAAFLQQLGLKKGSHVAIFSKNCAEWFIADFGIHLAGMVSVPLFTNQRAENLQYILKHAAIELVFVGKLEDPQLVRDYIPNHLLTISFDYHELEVNYSWADVLTTQPLQELVEPSPENLYTIIYTSGTVGSAKGAMFTNKTIASYLALFPQDLCTIRKLNHYKLVSYLPLAHVYERSAIQLGSVAINCDVSFIESLSRFAQNLREIQPTFFTAVPRIWGVFQEKIEAKIPHQRLHFLLKIPLISQLIKYKIAKELGLNQCKNAFSGASALPISMIEFFDKIGIYIQEGYGQTENFAYATTSLLNERRPGYVGTARLGVEIKEGGEGELMIYSPCLMSGYYKDPEATSKSFSEEHWLHTGDIGTLDRQGRVKIIGRISENFKNQSGEFVSPSPIERQMASNGMIAQSCLVGRGLRTNVLVITLNDSIKLVKKEDIIHSLQARLAQVNSTLAKYERIGHILITKQEWTPNNNLLTPTLKVRRRVVEQHYSDLIHRVLNQPELIMWE